jgi:hypothetical protein
VQLNRFLNDYKVGTIMQLWHPSSIRFITIFFAEKNCFFPISFQVTKYMKQPIFVYYELDNFYQNHRRYGVF